MSLMSASFSGLGEDELDVGLLSVVVDSLEDGKNELLVDVVKSLDLVVTLGDEGSDLGVEGSVDLGKIGSLGHSLGLESLSDGLSHGENIGVPELVGSEHGLSHVEFVVVGVVASVLISVVTISVISGLVLVVLVLGLLLVELPDLVELGSLLVLSVGKVSLGRVSLVVELVSEGLLSPEISVPVLSLVLVHTSVDRVSGSVGISGPGFWDGSVEELSLGWGPVENLGWSRYSWVL